MTTGQLVQLQEARQLYEDGLSLRQVAARVGITHNAVKKRLLKAGVTLRPAHRPITNTNAAAVRARERRQASRRRYLRVVPDAPRPAQRALTVPPERTAIAFTADRGWHMVQAPPGWFLELLAELD